MAAAVEAAVEAVESGRLYPPEPLCRPGILSAVAEEEADRAASPEASFRQGRFALQGAEVWSRKLTAQRSPRKEA